MRSRRGSPRFWENPPCGFCGLCGLLPLRGKSPNADCADCSPTPRGRTDSGPIRPARTFFVRASLRGMPLDTAESHPAGTRGVALHLALRLPGPGRGVGGEAVSGSRVANFATLVVPPADGPMPRFWVQRLVGFLAASCEQRPLGGGNPLILNGTKWCRPRDGGIPQN